MQIEPLSEQPDMPVRKPRRGRKHGSTNKRQSAVLGLRVPLELRERITLYRRLSGRAGSKMIVKGLSEIIDAELGRLLTKPLLSPLTADRPAR